MTRAGSIEIRSYGVCFSLERRIHRLERWRIPVPYGVPVRGIAYYAATLLAILIASKLPVLSQLLGGLNPAIRYLGLPALVAGALMRWTVDGRPAHQVIRAWLRFMSEPKRVLAFRAARERGRIALDDVAVAPDERSAQLRCGRVEGPATVVFRYPIDARPRGRSLQVRRQAGPALWRGKQVELRPGQRLVIR